MLRVSPPSTSSLRLPLLFIRPTKSRPQTLKLHHIRLPHHLFRLPRGQGSQGIKTTLPPQIPTPSAASSNKSASTPRTTSENSSHGTPESSAPVRTRPSLPISPLSATLAYAPPPSHTSSSSTPPSSCWLDFFGGNEEALVTAFRHNLGMASHDIGRTITPNISILRSHGLSTHEIRMVVLRAPRLITTGVGVLDNTLNRAEELGFRPGSNKFAQGLLAMYANSRDMLRKKKELFERFNWSEDEFLAALQKGPLWVTLSEKTLQDKMDFFIGEAVCDPSCIAANPMLLAFSLEKRLRPRVRVLHLLESRGYCDENRGFYYKICLSNEKFVGTYVSPHKEEIPELLEAYRPAATS